MTEAGADRKDDLTEVIAADKAAPDPVGKIKTPGNLQEFFDMWNTIMLSQPTRDFLQKLKEYFGDFVVKAVEQKEKLPDEDEPRAEKIEEILEGACELSLTTQDKITEFFQTLFQAENFPPVLKAFLSFFRHAIHARFRDFCRNFDNDLETFLKTPGGVLEFGGIFPSQKDLLAQKEDFTSRRYFLYDSVEKIPYLFAEDTTVSFDIKEVDAASAHSCVAVDSEIMEEIIFELARNARDALRNKVGQKIIKFSSRKEGDFVIFTVSDNGDGVAPEVLEKLLKEPVSTNGEGRGNGLYLMKIVLNQIYHGDISIESEPDKGTTVTLKLPAAIIET